MLTEAEMSTNPLRIAFFDAKPYDRRSFDDVNGVFGFEITYFEERLHPGTVALASGFPVVCVFVNDVVDRKVVEHLVANGTDLLALRCAGYNNVDFKAAYGKLHVVRVPAYSPHAVAEHAAALLLSLNRKTHKSYYRTREGNFNINGLLGFDLHGKTAGIIGTGRIGRCLVPILQGFGMEILVYDAHPDEEYAEKVGIRYVSLTELYANADVISLHCPLLPETQYLIDAESIGRMKRGVVLINTSRGKLIDTQALITGLKSGRIGAAGLDVYEEEGNYFFEDLSTEMIDDDVLARLLTFPNVLVTSHQGFFTREALENIARTTLQNIGTFQNGQASANEICYHCQDPCKRKQGKPCF